MIRADEGEHLFPDAHYFVRSKHPWVVIPDGIPAWDTLPPNPAGQTRALAICEDAGGAAPAGPP